MLWRFTRQIIRAFFMENGLFLHPLGSTIYIQAPYVITEQQLEKIYSVIETALETL